MNEMDFLLHSAASSGRWHTKKDGNIMLETVGTLTLKIAQLEQRLGMLKQRLVLSSPYPDVNTQLTQVNAQTERQLQQLQQYKQLLSITF
jgi:hypothetical protein